MEDVTLKIIANNQAYPFIGFAKDLFNLEYLRIVRIKDENYDFESISNGMFEGIFGDNDEDEKLEIELQKEEYRHHVERFGVYKYIVQARTAKKDEWEDLNELGGSCGVGDDIYETSLDLDLLKDGVEVLAKALNFR